MYKSIAFTEKSLVMPESAKRLQHEPSENQDFLDLIGKSKQLINELHILEQEHIEKEKNEEDMARIEDLKNGKDDMEAF